MNSALDTRFVIEFARRMAGSDKLELFVALSLSTLALLAPTNAMAQEVTVREPVVGCIALLLRDSVPANFEWAYWASGGGGFHTTDSSRGFGVLGVGTEGTTGLFEVGAKHRYGGPFEFRGGPWWSLVSDFRGARAEGGYVISFGQVSHAQWGTYTLRMGGGLGEDGLGLSQHFVATLTGGVRYAGQRYSERGACDPKPRPKSIAMVDQFRLFATARSTLKDGAPWQFTFGVEFSPTFFLPPYSLGKWIGARL